MATKGYFIITDISGYTEYLTESELDHAHEILQSLFDVQLAHIKFPLKISGFRGDAIFMYTPDTCFVNPQSFLETLENLYIVFSDTLQQMQVNTTCTCRACKNMNKLDLKMCIHFGEYLVQKLGDREELLGADVIVPHRMLKNKVIEQTGIKSYALFSQSAAEALRLSELCQPLTPHHETYEHIGEVRMLVHNLRTAWEREQARNDHIVDAENAWFKVEFDIPHPPSLVWDYLTNPELEAPFLGLEYVKRDDDLGGRTREGSSFHCAHKSGDFYNRVVDWKPFDHYTVHQTGIAGLDYYRMICLIPSENGTHFLCCFSQPSNEAPAGLREQLQVLASEGYKNLEAGIQIGIESGKISET
jgi:uncharacterized protein DUF2652